MAVIRHAEAHSGPGGSTQRLHHDNNYPEYPDSSFGAETGSTGAVDVVTRLGGPHRIEVKPKSANDNDGEIALAA